MQPYSSTNMVTAWKNSYFIRDQIFTVINLSIAVHTLLIYTYILFLYLFYNSDGVKKTQMIHFASKKILHKLISGGKKKRERERERD